ncbi:hypothetical protein GB937_004804 [Aspergillus fischeri]|nr:hypothetical protein GB937_004804 [Aspergillus fischeri]
MEDFFGHCPQAVRGWYSGRQPCKAETGAFKSSFVVHMGSGSAEEQCCHKSLEETTSEMLARTPKEGIELDERISQAL